MEKSPKRREVIWLATLGPARHLSCGAVAGIEPRLGVATCQPVHAVRGGDLSALRRAPSSWLDLTSDLAWLGLACAARSMGALEVALAFPGPFSNRFMDRLGSYTAGYNRLRTFVCSLSSVTLPSRPKRIIRYPYTAGVCTVHCTSPRSKVEPSRWDDSNRMGEARGGRQSSFIAGCRAAQQHEWSPCRRFVSAKHASPGGSARASHSASLLAYRSPLCARGFTCHMPRMHAQARAQVWRQHACKTHASAHHSALLAQEGAPL